MIKRGALIGCGFFAENHLHAWSQVEGAEITALCDLSMDRLNEVGDQFGVASRFTELSSLFASDHFDFVDIATTAHSHRKLVTTAVDHVETIICQKPFAENMADAEAMVGAAARENVSLLVHENFRWQRPFVEMKALVDAGAVGRPHFAQFSFRHGYDNYANQPYLAEIERFSIMDVGLHLFDLARVFLGDVERLSCSTQRLNKDVRGEDAFTALLQHDSGATCVCDASFQSTYTPEPFPNTSARIEGDAGTIELDRDYLLRIHDQNGVREQRLEPTVPCWGSRPWHGVQDSVLRFQQHALDVMNGRAQPRPSGADNLNTLMVALAAYEAADNGRSIDLNAWSEASS